MSLAGGVISKLWDDDPERFWPYARRLVTPVTLWLAPSHGYGADRVPATGGGVVAANHLSAIDPPLVGSLGPRTLYYMAKAELFAMPVVGDALTWTGALPVRRGTGDRDSLRLAREIAGAGHMVGVFVEGTRQKFGYPGDVLPGAMMIALQERVPVVPCGVYSFGWSRRKRMPCAVVWGEPMDLSSMPASARGYRRAAELVGDEIRHLWRQAGEAIAAGFPETLADGARRSGPIYPPLGTVPATPSTSTSAKKAAA
ncbi:MAG: lysophospholipid acyltransferase family protein [Gaiellaceae bacterium]